MPSYRKGCKCSPIEHLMSSTQLHTTSCLPQLGHNHHSNHLYYSKVCRIEVLHCLSSILRSFFSLPPRTSIFFSTILLKAEQSPASLSHSLSPPSLPSSLHRTSLPASNSCGIPWPGSILCSGESSIKGRLVKDLKTVGCCSGSC